MRLRQAVFGTLAVTLLLAMVLTGVRSQVAVASTPLERYGVELHIKPVVAAPGQMVAEAVITDLSTGRLVSSPRVRFNKGQAAEIKQGFQAASGRDQLIEINIDVAADGKLATYTATTRLGLSESDSIQQTQKVVFHLSE